MGWSSVRVNQNGSQLSWFLDQSFYEIMVTITSSFLKGNVPAVLCAVLCTVQVCLVCSEGRELLCFVSLHFDI